jgi:hypothetical protein
MPVQFSFINTFEFDIQIDVMDNGFEIACV